MGNIVTRALTSNMAASVASKPAAKQLYSGAGILLAASLDRTDSSGLITTVYDSARASTTDPVIYTQTGDADLGLTVPVFFAGDADIVAGTSTAGVGPGLIFADGLYVVNSGDSTDTAIAWTFWIKPLIRKSVKVLGASGTSNIFHGPGLWHGYRITLDPASPSTLDITFTDEASPNDSGPTVMTKTNYATTAKTLRKVATTTGEDEAGAAVTTAATGSYGNPGIYLRKGLSVTLAQGTANQPVEIEALFEA